MPPNIKLFFFNHLATDDIYNLYIYIEHTHTHIYIYIHKSELASLRTLAKYGTPPCGQLELKLRSRWEGVGSVGGFIF